MSDLPIVHILEWCVFLLMVPVVSGRHAPSAAIAWLIFIFVKPWLGLICYLIAGDNVVIKRRSKTYCQRLGEVRALDHLSVQEPHIFRSPEDPRIRHLAALAERMVCAPILGGNAVDLLDNGFTVIDRMIADIDAAERHVHMLFYIFSGGREGRRVAEALARAVERGVCCRLVVDAFGSRSLPKTLEPWMRERGVEVHYLMTLNPFRRHLSRLDLRNHRKLVVVDGKIAYTGSQNIEDKDYGDRRPDAWHDLMVRVTGPVVLQMQLVFTEDYYIATGVLLDGQEFYPIPETEGDVPIQVMPSGPLDSTTILRDLLISAIHRARDRVVITSPYFIPDESLLLALHLAALRGVDVELLIPRHADHPIVGAVARAYFDRLIDSGIVIRFHEGILHAKTMSVDDTVALIGTANFDRRSFFLHSELSLLLYGPEITARLYTKQREYAAQSEKLEVGRWCKGRSRLKRMRDDVMKLLSPLL